MSAIGRSIVLLLSLLTACAPADPRWEALCPWDGGLEGEALETLETEDLAACEPRAAVLDTVGTDGFSIASGTMALHIDGAPRGPWRLGVRNEQQGEVLYVMGCVRGAAGLCLSLDLQMYIGRLVDGDPLTVPHGVANGPDSAFQGLLDINHTEVPRTLDMASLGNTTGEIVVERYIPADGLLSGRMDLEVGDDSSLPSAGPGRVTATFDLEW